MPPMHNAYCSLVENSELVRHFINREKGIVKIEEHEPDLEAVLEKEGIIPTVDGIATIETAFGAHGILCTKDEKGNFIPMRYNDIPAKQFFDWVDRTEGIEMVGSDSDDFYYEFKNADPKATLRKYTTKLVLSMLQDERCKTI